MKKLQFPMKSLSPSICLQLLFCTLFSTSAHPQLRVDDRVPIDKKACLAAIIDVDQIYKSKLGKILLDSAIISDTVDIPWNPEFITKIRVFVNAPPGVNPKSLQATDFYVAFDFKNEKAPAEIADFIQQQGGKNLEIKGHQLIAAPDEIFFLKVNQKTLELGSRNALTSPSKHFASRELTHAFAKLPITPVKVLFFLDGARDFLADISAIANARVEPLSRPYVKLIDEVSSVSITSDLENGPLLKISLTGHNENHGQQIKRKLDAIVGIAKQFAGTNSPGNTLIERTLLDLIQSVDAQKNKTTVSVEFRKPAGFEEMMTELVKAAWVSAKRVSDEKNFREILIALHNYHDVHGEFPFGKHVAGEHTGKGFSWAVHVLPLLEQQELYNSFDLAENYDSPKNAIAGQTEIKQLKLKTGGQVTWVKPSRIPLRFSDIVDGTSNTVAFVQNRKVDMLPWTKAKSIKPADVIYQFKGLRNGESMIFGM